MRFNWEKKTRDVTPGASAAPTRKEKFSKLDDVAVAVLVLAMLAAVAAIGVLALAVTVFRPYARETAAIFVVAGLCLFGFALSRRPS